MNQRADRSPKPRPFSSGPLAFAILLLLAPMLARAEQVDVAEELDRLMTANGFTMKPADVEATRETKARVESEELIPRLRVLLEGFDHVIVQKPGGGVDRVLILGAKVPYTPPPPETAEAPREASPQEGEATDTQAAEAPATDNPETETQTTASQDEPRADIVLQTQRKGTSHAMSLMIEGQNGKRIPQVLLLDTGADFVVLPTSLINTLGIRPHDLRHQSVQTANGTVNAQLGTLPAVWLGNQRVARIAAAFIEDARLGGNALLGMSVLSRFRVTIDDSNNRVVLAGP